MGKIIKVLTFDVTNTLIKVASDVGHQYNHILMKSKFNLELDKDLTNKNFRRLFKEQNVLYPGYGYRQGMSSRNWWSLITKQVIKANFEHHKHEYKLSEDDLDVASNLIFDEFCLKQYWETFDNCGKTLKDLKNSNYQLGVISNFDERIYKILENLELIEYFDFIRIPSNSNGLAKPSNQIFQYTVERAVKKPNEKKDHQFLHIGDNIDLDYRASRACGFKALLMCHNNADQTLHTLEKDDEIIKNEDYATDLLDLKKKILEKF